VEEKYVDRRFIGMNGMCKYWRGEGERLDGENTEQSERKKESKTKRRDSLTAFPLQNQPSAIL